MAIPVSIRFYTNVRYKCIHDALRGNNGIPVDTMNPIVGDIVQIYSDSAISVYMQVSKRHWQISNGVPHTLAIELIPVEEKDNPTEYAEFCEFINCFSSFEKGGSP